MSSSVQQICESAPFFIHLCAPGLQFSWNIPPDLMELVVVYLSISPYKKCMAITRGSSAALPSLCFLLHWNMWARRSRVLLQSNLGVMPWASPSWGRLREGQACEWGEAAACWAQAAQCTNAGQAPGLRKAAGLWGVRLRLRAASVPLGAWTLSQSHGGSDCFHPADML